MNSSAWWRDAAIYQVYPRSFRDSNGDGEGDLQGVIAGLPYLADLGIDAIWLSPFYKSPNKDGGYDVSDPRDVDPRFGTLADAKELIEAAHSHGIKFIADIVPNHFSSEHIWFQEALASPKGSAARSRFHFYDGRGENGEIPPNNWISIFRGPAWTRTADGQWYLHLFDSSQPDLNWDNPDVMADFEKTLRFWLDLGVDGFRIDVAHGTVKENLLIDHRDPERLIDALRLDFLDISEEERAGLLSDVPFFDREGIHEVYRKWRKVLNEYPGDRMTVAEAFVYPSSRAARYVRADELHQVFNFNFMMLGWDAAAMRASIERTLSELIDVKAPATWVLNNHDTPRVVTRIGGAQKARALAMLIHALPGGIYIYQGEELGLFEVADLKPEDLQDPNWKRNIVRKPQRAFFKKQGKMITGVAEIHIEKGRDGCRVPLPWTSTGSSFGFGSGKAHLPQPREYGALSMQAQSKIKGSTLDIYRTALKLRKKLQTTEELEWIKTGDPQVLHLSRKNGWHCITNFDGADFTLPKGEILHSSSPLKGRKLPKNTTVWLKA